MKLPTIAYFTGVRPGNTNGHYVYLPGYKLAHNEPLSPWGWTRWPLGEGHPTGHYPLFCLDKQHGWTRICCLDNSAEKRGGTATFAFDTELDLPDAISLAEELFPEVFDRMRRFYISPSSAT